MLHECGQEGRPCKGASRSVQQVWRHATPAGSATAR